MKRNAAPSAFDLIFLVVAPLTAILGSVKLTQNDGDLSAHLRMGASILATHRVPGFSLASYTAGSDPLVAHAWLSEVILLSLFKLGGLPLLSVFTGLLIGLTHGALAVFLRKRGADPRWALLAALISLTLAATHWATRPHMFSIIGAALSLFLLELRPRHHQIMIVGLFALWANLHGGWLYGLIMIGAFACGEFCDAALSSTNRSKWLGYARQDAISLCLATGATMLNPYGVGLHKEVVFAVTSRSLSDNIIEYLSPNFHDGSQLPFLLAILLTVALFAFTTRRPPLSWLFLILVSLAFSLRSARNIALFGVTAWPLIALSAAAAGPNGRRPFPFFNEFARLDPNSRIGLLAVPVAIGMLAIGINRGRIGPIEVIPDAFSAKALPTIAVERASKSLLEGRVYDAWEWGGYIMYAWPSARLHVDPLKFNSVTMQSYSVIDGLRPGWQAELAKWRVRTVIIRSASPLAKSLEIEPGWKVWYRDSLATVFRPAAANDPPAFSGG